MVIKKSFNIQPRITFEDITQYFLIKKKKQVIGEFMLNSIDLSKKKGAKSA